MMIGYEHPKAPPSPSSVDWVKRIFSHWYGFMFWNSREIIN